MRQDGLKFHLQASVLIGKMRREGERLGCDPRQLGIAILFTVFHNDMVDNILDGDDPKAIAPRYAMKAPRNEPGSRQREMLAWVIRKGKATGSFTCSFRAAAAELKWHIGDVSTVARSLHRRGDIVLSRAKHQSPSVWTLAQHLLNEEAAA